MARINVEEDWFFDIDGRRSLLIEAVGNRFTADGMALNAWRLAQRYWARDHGLIPEDIWQRSGLEPLVDAGLAERRDDGVYVKGTKEQHAWLVQRVEAGRKRGHGERDEKGKFVQRPASGTPPDSSEIQRPVDSAGHSSSDIQRDSSDEPAATSGSPASSSDNVSTSNSNPIGKPPTSGRGHPPSAFDQDLARRWADHATEILPRLKPKLEEWANVVRLLREKDGLSEADLDATLAFVRSDHFWQHNAVSLPGIRQKSKNGLRKIDNILVAMKRPQKAKPQPPKATTEADFDW